jgi:uncharacterized protein YjiS (DUF1127 family)
MLKPLPPFAKDPYDASLEPTKEPALSAWKALTRRPRTWFATFAEYRRTQRAIAELQGLDDRILKDIGLARSEIEYAVHASRYYAHDRFTRYDPGILPG